jgi:hypothetical protein
LRSIVVVATFTIALIPAVASAQGAQLYGQRLASNDGKWLLPVATRLLGSTDDDHVRRGSINSWDLSASIGSPVWAAAPGVVVAAGCNLYETRQWSRMQGYGCAVELSHGNGIHSQYGHCATGSIQVRKGDQVMPSTLICQVGMTGKTSFQHVHFTILRNGSPIRIDTIFDIRQMQRCHLCSGKNDPSAPVTGATLQRTQAPAATVASGTRYEQLLRIVAQYPPQLIALVVVGLFGLLILVMWLGGKWERIAVVSLASGMLGAWLFVWLFVPVTQPVQAQSQPVIVQGGSTWKAAYGFMRRWEGGANPPCVHDPVRTLKGVTQHTYTAWRMSQGLGPADVCTSLTEAQAEAIYYQRYWLASGADRLSPAVAVAHFDHAVNAGVGAAKRILAQCGDNIQCYINARLADYRTKGNYATYGRAWTNRVNDLINYLQKGK